MALPILQRKFTSKSGVFLPIFLAFLIPGTIFSLFWPEALLAIIIAGSISCYVCFLIFKEAAAKSLTYKKILTRGVLMIVGTPLSIAFMFAITILLASFVTMLFNHDALPGFLEGIKGFGYAFLYVCCIGLGLLPIALIQITLILFSFYLFEKHHDNRHRR